MDEKEKKMERRKIRKEEKDVRERGEKKGGRKIRRKTEGGGRSEK